MKHLLAPLLTALVWQIALAESEPRPDNPEQAHADSFKKRFAADLSHPPESEARLNKWFRDSKYGVFIHFGAYSQLAGHYKGKTDGPPYAEWAMMTYRIPFKEYRDEVVAKFDPRDFDADEWARTFKALGFRYVVITSKHHDGFALFQSGVTDYNVVDATPFRRDIIKELSEACHREGLKFGVYYSQAFDWSEPGAPFPSPEAIRQIHPELPADYTANEQTMEEYLARKSLPQVEELMKNYKIDLVWFDTPASMKPEQGQRFLEAVRKNNPDCLVNSRLLYWPKERWTAEQLQFFDYVSLEDKEVPPHKLSLTTESPDSVSTSYGYKAHGFVRYHTLQEILHRFIQTVCGGGNYLVNFGPMGNGAIDPKALELFSGVGAWLEENGESIHGTQTSPFPRPAWGCCTQKKHDNGTTLYLHVLDWPKDGKLRVSGLENKVKSATLLANGEVLEFEKIPEGVEIELPGKALDPNATVIKLEIVGEPKGRIHQFKTRWMKKLDDSDIEEKFSRSSGPGGQHVNKVSTAVTLRHVPTGLSVTVSDSRSQAMNRETARRRLLRKINEAAEAKKLAQLAEVSRERRRKAKRSRGTKAKLVESKRRRSETKKLRGKVS